MTQSNPPGEIKCPHCRQTYAVAPQQWPQYQGRSIACTKCGQQFVVGGAAGAPVGMPPALPPMAAGYPPQAPGYPPQGYAYAPPKKGMSGGIIALIVIACLAVPCGIVALLISILLPALNKVREEALKAKCSSNMKNIAAAMITYSNSNNGQYPDSMSTLVRTSGSPMTIFVCPDSSDTPLPSASSATSDAALVGHNSYIYVAGSVTSSTAGPDTVLVYESLSDHHGKGINVLYGDYHVAWMPASQAQLLISNLPPGGSVSAPQAPSGSP